MIGTDEDGLRNPLQLGRVLDLESWSCATPSNAFHDFRNDGCTA